MAQKTCNLQAVAHALGLSRSTVSLALRDDVRIPSATRQRVRHAADEMGYAANPLIATLMSTLRRGIAPRTATMADIARHAGVSRAMVSLVLRHPGRGAPAMVKKINAAARQLGYRRDPLHAAFATYRRRHAHRDKHTTIAFVATHPVNSPWRRFRSYVQMFEGASRRAGELGYRLEEFNCSRDGLTPHRLRSVLLARNIHAMVVAPLPGRLTHLDFDVDSFACVGLGSGFQDPPFECVSNDQFQSIGLAMQKCEALGLRRIGLVVSRDASERLGGRWLGGFLLAQQSAAESTRVPPLMPETTEEIGAQLPRWLRNHRPDVVMFAHNELEKSVFLPLRPKVGIVSLHVMDPNGVVTGIYQASGEVGARAVDLVVSRLQNYGTKPITAPGIHFVPGQWIEGKTGMAP